MSATHQMTVRQQIAVAAMAGILQGEDDWDEAIVAISAFKMADAMLDESDRLRPSEEELAKIASAIGTVEFCGSHGEAPVPLSEQVRRLKRSRDDYKMLAEQWPCERAQKILSSLPIKHGGLGKNYLTAALDVIESLIKENNELNVMVGQNNDAIGQLGKASQEVERAGHNLREMTKREARAQGIIDTLASILVEVIISSPSPVRRAGIVAYLSVIGKSEEAERIRSKGV